MASGHRAIDPRVAARAVARAPCPLLSHPDEAGQAFAGRADTALAKIEAALPADRVRELRHVAGRILVGEPASSSPDPMGAIDPALLPTFERAFTRHRVLVFSCIDRAGRRSRRRVEPHALLVRAPLWYIVAWDVDRDAARLFRMDRIQRPVVRDDEGFGARPFGAVSGVCPDAVGASRAAQR